MTSYDLQVRDEWRTGFTQSPRHLRRAARHLGNEWSTSRAEAIAGSPISRLCTGTPRASKGFMGAADRRRADRLPHQPRQPTGALRHPRGQGWRVPQRRCHLPDPGAAPSVRRYPRRGGELRSCSPTSRSPKTTRMRLRTPADLRRIGMMQGPRRAHRTRHRHARVVALSAFTVAGRGATSYPTTSMRWPSTSRAPTRPSLRRTSTRTGQPSLGQFKKDALTYAILPFCLASETLYSPRTCAGCRSARSL